MLARSKNVQICKTASLVIQDVKKETNVTVYLNTNHGRLEIPKKRSLKKNVTFTPAPRQHARVEFDFDDEDLHISVVENPEKNNFDHFISANQ